MTKQFRMELAGRPLLVEVGRVAAQANGAALMHYGETVVLSTATASEITFCVSVGKRCSSPIKQTRIFLSFSSRI